MAKILKDNAFRTKSSLQSITETRWHAHGTLCLPSSLTKVEEKKVKKDMCYIYLIILACKTKLRIEGQEWSTDHIILLFMASYVSPT